MAFANQLSSCTCCAGPAPPLSCGNCSGINTNTTVFVTYLAIPVTFSLTYVSGSFIYLGAGPPKTYTGPYWVGTYINPINGFSETDYVACVFKNGYSLLNPNVVGSLTLANPGGGANPCSLIVGQPFFPPGSVSFELLGNPNAIYWYVPSP